MSVSQTYGFSSRHVWMWELGNKESWVLKNWCFWTVVFGKTLESPLDYKENKPVNPKENQSWIFIGRTAAEVEALILWLPDVKNWLLGKYPDAEKDWRQEEKGRQKMRNLDGIINSMDMSLNKLQWWTGEPGMLQSTGSQRVRHDWETDLNGTNMAIKWTAWKKMDRLLEKSNLLRLNQEEIGIMNKSVTSIETETVI